ncbi:MAG: type II toxin-antitoxin system RelE/ParE family toxin [Dehalococcoidia bacterium]|nr:type II toxin-antitoxin system RelE/ParE family toxin [Dehalococcoidia bacterium]
MQYQVEFFAEAEADLAELDTLVKRRVGRKIKWLSENFKSIVPEALSGEFKGKYKLRVGDYRVVYSINPNLKLILIHLIGHRREIYK